MKQVLLPRSHRCFRLAIGALIALLTVAATKQAQAGFIQAADLSGNVQGALGQPANTTIGFSFTVGNNPFTFNALGLDSGTGFVATPMNVHIWKAGSATDVAQASISNADPLSLDGRFFYAGISPVTLVANTIYDIGVDLPFGNQGAMFGGIVVSNPDITVTGAISGPSGSFPTADNKGIGVGPLFGPTLGIVPEPSSLVLAACGAIGLAAWGWRRRGPLKKV